jgi:hypothetical protein
LTGWPVLDFGPDAPDLTHAQVRECWRTFREFPSPFPGNEFSYRAPTSAHSSAFIKSQTTTVRSSS